MNELDERLRRGLEDATDGIGRVDADELVAQLESRRATEPAEPLAASSRSRRPLAVAAVVALIAGVLGVGALVSNHRDDERRVVADGSGEAHPSGFEGWTAGWHELDTGPVPVGEPPSLAWFDGRLYAAASIPPADGSSASPRAGLWVFDPVEREWSTLTAPPFHDLELVATSTGLVAVGGPTDGIVAPLDRRLSWATWEPDDGDLAATGWTDHGVVPVAEGLRAAGSPGPTPPSVDRSLLWTGEVVIDLTVGAVLDPAAGTSGPLEMPDDLLRYTHLLQATPVWTGSRVVVVGWSTQPGLSWSRDGTFAGEVPAPTMADASFATGAAAVAVDGDVVLVARDELGGDARVARLDDENQWTTLPPVPESTEAWCPYFGAPVGDGTVGDGPVGEGSPGGSVVVQGCSEQPDGPSARTSPYRLDGDTWSALPPAPRDEQGIERWLGTDDALVVWTGDADTANNPDAPFQWAAVWIPERRPGTAGTSEPGSAPTDPTPTVPTPTVPTPTVPTPTAATVPTTTSTQAPCAVDELPDIRFALPESLDVEPAPGIGGWPSSETFYCARHWTDPDDPAHHVTQQPGGSSFPIVGGEWVGGFRWGEIHEGHGAEYTGSITVSGVQWGLMGFGFDDGEFEAFVERLAAQIGPAPD